MDYSNREFSASTPATEFHEKPKKHHRQQLNETFPHPSHQAHHQPMFRRTNMNERQQQQQANQNLSMRLRSNEPFKIAAGKYTVGRKIGGGSFGDIYWATDQNGNEVAVKMEHLKKKNPHLFYECRLYKALQGGLGIPSVYYYGAEGEFVVMVMDLLGPSLEDLFIYCGRRFKLHTVCMLADQMLQRIEFCHTLGVIHRDIKPHNFLIGRSNRSHLVHVIDFGLAKKFKCVRTGAHIPYIEGKNLTGTARYVSVSTHLGCEQSRRDDLESLFYVYLYFLKSSLPWQGLKAHSKKDKYDRIMDMKISTPIETLCAGVPNEFQLCINYCRQLGFSDRPDYAFLRRMIKELLFREGNLYDFRFDWLTSTTEDVRHLTSNSSKRVDNMDSHQEYDPPSGVTIATDAEDNTAYLRSQTKETSIGSGDDGLNPAQKLLVVTELSPNDELNRSETSTAISDTIEP